jgi:hypothetical protein
MNPLEIRLYGKLPDLGTPPDPGSVPAKTLFSAPRVPQGKDWGLQVWGDILSLHNSEY